MPPPSFNSPQTVDPSHLLARPRPVSGGGLPAHERRSGIGATMGIVIILVLVAFGALYFWGAYLNQKNSVDQLPFIPEGTQLQ